jgi:hypothetical protein
MNNWPNSLVCTDIYQCGARRDAEFVSLCYIHTYIQFEFSLKIKVMGSNLGYLLKSFLLYEKQR